MHRIIIVLLRFSISIQWTIGLCKLIFNLAPSVFTQFEPHGFTCSEPCCGPIKRPIFWKLPGFGISNKNFLITDVIEFLSGTMITFSAGGGGGGGVRQKSNLSSFQSLAPGLHCKNFISDRNKAAVAPPERIVFN